MALKHILSAKFGTCSGQVCLAADYILVEANYAPKLIELLKEMIKKMYGERPDELASNMTRIINKPHFKRLKSLLDETCVQESVVYGGFMDENSLMIGPTILLNPPLDVEIMSEEIFGPILPIITLENIEESIDYISSRPKPLALYCFSKDEKLKKRFTTETISGSLVFNDTILQYAVETIPFGGVGESGFGRYHEKFGFDTFSHEKAILKRNYLIDFWFRYPGRATKWSFSDHSTPMIILI